MKRAYCDTRHGQIHYYHEGEAGPALILLASSGRSGIVYDGLIQRLSGRFRVLAVDMLGAGNSDPLPAGAGFEQMAETLADLVDATGIGRANLYGLHTGNKVAASFAVQFPDRVPGLAIAGQSHSLIPDATARNAAILGHVKTSLPDAAPRPAEFGLIESWVAGGRRFGEIWWNAELFRGLPDRDALDRARHAAIDRLQAMPGVAATYGANFTYDLAADLGRLRQHTLVIEIATPAEDAAFGRQGAELLRLIPSAELVTYEEPDGPSHATTLAGRYAELAELLTGFFLGNAS